MQINGISSECVTIPLFHWPTESDRGAVAGKNFCTKIVLQCFAKFCLCIHEFAGFAQPMRGGGRTIKKHTGTWHWWGIYIFLLKKVQTSKWTIINMSFLFCVHWLPGCGCLDWLSASQFCKRQVQTSCQSIMVKEQMQSKILMQQKPISNNSTSKHHLKLKRRFRSLACLCHVMGAKNKENWASWIGKSVVLRCVQRIQCKTSTDLPRTCTCLPRMEYIFFHNIPHIDPCTTRCTGLLCNLCIAIHCVECSTVHCIHRNTHSTWSAWTTCRWNNDMKWWTDAYKQGKVHRRQCIESQRGRLMDKPTKVDTCLGAQIPDAQNTWDTHTHRIYMAGTHNTYRQQEILSATVYHIDLDLDMIWHNYRHDMQDIHDSLTCAAHANTHSFVAVAFARLLWFVAGGWWWGWWRRRGGPGPYSTCSIWCHVVALSALSLGWHSYTGSAQKDGWESQGGTKQRRKWPIDSSYFIRTFFEQPDRFSFRRRNSWTVWLITWMRLRQFFECLQW